MSLQGSDFDPQGQHGPQGPSSWCMPPVQGTYPKQMQSQPMNQYGQHGLQNASSQQQHILNFPSLCDMPMPFANMSGLGYRDSSAIARMSTPNVMSQRPPSNTSTTSSIDSLSGNLGNQQPISGSGNRQFPFGDQVSKPHRLVSVFMCLNLEWWKFIIGQKPNKNNSSLAEFSLINIATIKH